MVVDDLPVVTKFFFQNLHFLHWNTCIVALNWKMWFVSISWHRLHRICLLFMMSANSRIRFALQIVLVCLYSTQSHYHHCAELSEDIELIKCLSDIFCRVCEIRLSIFSQLSIIQSIIQYMGLCIFSLPTPLVMIERIYILHLVIIIKSEVWTITHCLGLGHETMVCAVCLSIFFWHVRWFSWTLLLSLLLSLFLG